MSIERKLIATTDAATSSTVYVEDVFSTWLYTGTGTSQTIANGIDLSTKGGLVWIKNRDNTGGANHFLHDTARDRTKFLNSSTTNAESSSVPSSITSWDTNGFTLGSSGNLNTSIATINSFASWTFAKQPKFFDVVTYTGTGSARTISHALGATPGMIIVKRTDTTSNWQVYHRSLTSAANSIQLNLTAAQASATTVWNSTAPTSSVFSVGTDATVNASGGTYVAYLFAHDAGGFGPAGTDSVVACGSYTGNGSASGPTVTLGWEPQYVLIKRADSTGSWFLFDNMRGMPIGSGDAILYADGAGAENPAGNILDVTATGFVLTATGVAVNASGGNYIYLAIRRGPMKTPTDATKVFDLGENRTSIASRTNGTVGPIDLTLQTQVPTPIAGYHFSAFDRLRGANALSTADTASEQSGAVTFDTQIGVKNGLWFSSGGLFYNFRRAPGFFDVVCYTGDGASSRSISHNLAVSPNLIIWKARSIGSTFWRGWSSEFPTQYFAAFAASSFISGSYISANSTTFSYSLLFGDDTNNTAGVTYVAYLFASCPGVSKVGSYTGNGSSQTIDCGFTNGARFVLIKRTDSTGDWYVWDSSRGIVSGNDPRLSLNTTAAEVTTDDSIDPVSSGFIVNQLSATNINVSGASYVFLSVA